VGCLIAIKNTGEGMDYLRNVLTGDALMEFRGFRNAVSMRDATAAAGGFNHPATELISHNTLI
jgi:hypothetical protein